MPVKPGKHKPAKRKDWQRVQILATVPHAVSEELNRQYKRQGSKYQSKADFVGAVVQGALERMEVPEQYRERLESIERNSGQSRQWLIERLFKLALPMLERSDLRNAKD